MLAALDHVTLRTAKLEETREFFEQILGLKPGFRPPFPFPGYWLYAGDNPIVHLLPGGGLNSGFENEFIDHAAFCLSDYGLHRSRLDAQEIPYSTMELPEIAERRTFIRTPRRNPSRTRLSRESN